MYIAVDSENLKDIRILYKNCNCYEPNKTKGEFDHDYIELGV